MGRRITQILFLTGLAGAAAFLYFFNPEAVLYPPCIFKKITGLQCPGCGSARACYHLLHGNFLTAVDYNILLTGFLPLLMIEGFSRLFFVERDSAPGLRLIEKHLRPITVLCVVLTFWILRNLPIYPFSLLSSDH